MYFFVSEAFFVYGPFGVHKDHTPDVLLWTADVEEQTLRETGRITFPIARQTVRATNRYGGNWTYTDEWEIYQTIRKLCVMNYDDDYFNYDPYEEHEQCEREMLRKMFGNEWIEGDDPYREAFDGHPDAYWNID